MITVVVVPATAWTAFQGLLSAVALHLVQPYVSSAGTVLVCQKSTDMPKTKHNVKVNCILPASDCQFKLGLTVHLCLRRRAPLYLVDYCTSVADVVSRQHLRSASRRQLVVPRHRLSTFGRRAFAVSGPMSWNSLPNSLRESACDDNISDDCF